MDSDKNNFKSCCFTGYRPAKFPFPLDPASAQYKSFENNLIDTVFSLAEEGVRVFYSGVAMGFDIIAAETVLILKEAYKKASIKLCLAIPFPEQSLKFDIEWLERYNRLLEAADEKIIVSQEYTPWCFMKRNEYMVDMSDCVVTWFDGKSGGTKNTVRYAESKGKKVFNLYKDAYNDHSNYDFFELIDNIDEE